MTGRPSTPAHSVTPSSLQDRPPNGQWPHAGELAALVLGVWFLGSGFASGYGVWAETHPALPVIDLQALWDGGRYGVFLSFTTTWLWLLLPAATLCLLSLPIYRRVFPVGDKRGLSVFDSPALELLERHPRPRYWAYALPPGGLGGLALFLLIDSPDVFTPMPIAGQILLLLTPIFLTVCAALLAQAAGPTQVHEVHVDAIDCTTVGEGPTATKQHLMLSRFRRRTIMPATAQRLSAGDRVLVEESLLGTGVLKLALVEKAPKSVGLNPTPSDSPPEPETGASTSDE